ncbi:hypothetical protein ACDF64_01300 [Agromyces sp. MMS24-JH15]|uniref:hypothetical protein n=1 Tax=Agromyces sp. MMS24-JH15 TaxID=3243765 RepID=UPI003747A147
MKLAPEELPFATMTDELRRVRSGWKTGWAIALLVAGAALAIFSIVNYDWWLEQAAAWQGRRSGGRGLVAPGAVLIGFAFAAYGLLQLIAWSFSWERVATGTRLRRLTAQQLRLAPQDAAAWLDRFRSGDPRTYLPLPVGKGSVACGLWIAKADGVAYATVSAKVDRAWHPLPVAVLRENAFVALREVPLDGFKNPATPAAIKGFLDPFLRA